MKRTKTDRFQISNEIEEKMIKLKLSNELPCKILMTMLNNYVNTGETYINKKLTLKLRNDIDRVIVVNLFNDINIPDTVVIEAKDKR